ncbi:MAG: nitrous oxide reductase family maturation protein NosD [Promethearchaeota archaeon]
MNSTKRISIILVILTYFSLFVHTVNQYSNLPKVETFTNSKNQIEKNLNSSSHWNLTGTPIFIDDTNPSKNWSITAATYNWCRGDGTPQNPYLIENVTINGLGSDSCIEIRNSIVHFTIKNCTLYNSGSDLDVDAGIKLDWVENGKLIDNNCSYNKANGIFLINSDNNNLSGNIVNNNTDNGVKLEESNYNTISGNKANYNCDGILLNSKSEKWEDWTSKNNISGNIVNNNTNQGISLNYCLWNAISNNTAIYNLIGIKMYGADYNNISGNIASNNFEDGLNNYLAEYNTFSGNRFYNNGNSGINIPHGYYSKVIDNFIDKNNDCGIYIGDTTSFVSRNSITNNNYGIFLEGFHEIYENNVDNNEIGICLVNSKNAKIINNSIINNTNIGLKLKGGYSNKILMNNVSYNINIGISILDAEDYNITDNKVNNNEIGIYLENTNTTYISGNNISNNRDDGLNHYLGNNNIFSGNKVYNNGNSGINISHGHYSKVMENFIDNNNDHGIYIDSSLDCIVSRNNITYNNYGIYGGAQIYENNVSYNTEYGIYLLDSIGNNISSNIVCNNKIGIYLENSNKTTILENNINNNTEFGLYLVKSNDNYIFNNDVCGNGKEKEEIGCKGNKFKNNECIKDTHENEPPIAIFIIIVISIAGAMVATGLYIFRKRFSREESISRTTLSSQELEELRRTEAEVSVEKERHTCVVHRGKIVGAMYLCPHCETYYCMKCATVLKKKGETCWACHNKIEL